MKISKKIILKTDLNEVVEHDLSYVLSRFAAVNPEKDISRSKAILQNVLSSFGIDTVKIEFEPMACGDKVIIKEGNNEG